MSQLMTYLAVIGIGVGLGIAALLFLKFRKPLKRIEEGVSEVEFSKGDGATIEYDRGLGGSPYYGKVTNLKEHGDLINLTLLDDDSSEITLYNLKTGEMGNLRLISSMNDLLHKKVKFSCNKDATGEIKINPDGTVWSTTLKTENAVLANLMAERRAYSKSLKDSDEFRQLIKINSPSFYAEHLEEDRQKIEEEEKKT